VLSWQPPSYSRWAVEPQLKQGLVLVSAEGSDLPPLPSGTLDKRVDVGDGQSSAQGAGGSGEVTKGRRYLGKFPTHRQLLLARLEGVVTLVTTGDMSVHV
jgi:hypothetical protein